jgi:hypothetical protein
MVTASTLKSPILVAIMVSAGIAVNLSIIGLFLLAALRDGQTEVSVVQTFTGLLGIAFGAAGPVITHMIYSLSGVPQPGEAATGTATATTITSTSNNTGGAGGN